MKTFNSECEACFDPRYTSNLNNLRRCLLDNATCKISRGCGVDYVLSFRFAPLLKTLTLEAKAVKIILQKVVFVLRSPLVNATY